LFFSALFFLLSIIGILDTELLFIFSFKVFPFKLSPLGV
jgi:hypothetical protein